MRTHTHRVSLERFDGAVAAEPADVNTHVRAAGGKGGVVLPVHVESRGCGEARGARVGGGDDTGIQQACRPQLAQEEQQQS